MTSSKIFLLILSEPFLKYLLRSETHKDGVSETKVSMRMSEFPPGLVMMETEALFPDRTAGRTES